MKLIVSTARPEQEAMTKPTYGYDESVVKLTGFPRYDLLQNEPTGKIILAPTWRNNLTVGANHKTGIRKHMDDFKNSDYYKFYQGLIDDKRLQQALRDNNMTCDFYVHPSFSSQARDFVGNKYVIMQKFPYNYKKAFNEGSILITDYSSVFFDFAYLKKPIIYTQFDRNTFYSTHNWQPGYFDFTKNGFGPVAYNLDESVNSILKIIANGCRLDESYKTRIENFYYKFDKNNSKRVYEAILGMNNQG